MSMEQTLQKLKFTLFGCWMFSTLLYGAETMIVTERRERKIEDFHIWVFSILEKGGGGGCGEIQCMSERQTS